MTACSPDRGEAGVAHYDGHSSWKDFTAGCFSVVTCGGLGSLLVVLCLFQGTCRPGCRFSDVILTNVDEIFGAEQPPG